MSERGGGWSEDPHSWYPDDPPLGEKKRSTEVVNLTPLEESMAAAILFMPELGHLTAGVTKEVIARCVRVAIMFGARPRARAPVEETPPPAAVGAILNLLRAGQIVGLDPREMTAIALEQLIEEQG